MKKTTPQLLAATALALIVAEVPAAVHAAQLSTHAQSIDTTTTGSAPHPLRLAQATDSAPAGEETEQQRRKPRAAEQQQSGDRQPGQQPPARRQPAQAGSRQSEEPARQPRQRAEPPSRPEAPAERPQPRAPGAERARPADGDGQAQPPSQREQPPQQEPPPPAARQPAERPAPAADRAAPPPRRDAAPTEGEAPRQPPQTRPEPRPQPRATGEQQDDQRPAPREQPQRVREPDRPRIDRPAGEPRATDRPRQPANQPDSVPPPAPAGRPAAESSAPRPAGGDRPSQARPGSDRQPENAAPVLDSQKEAPPRRGDGAQEGGRPAQPSRRPPPAEAGPPPASDRDAQREAIRLRDIAPVTGEQGRRIEGERPPRPERREGVDIMREIGNRIIVDLGGRPSVQSSDRPRMERGARDVYYEQLPRERTRETILRPNGVRIVTIRDRYGEVIRRSRVMADGREYVLSYVDEDRRGPPGGGWRDPGADLPPLVLGIPVRDYILNAEDAHDEEAYYDFLDRPPVERVPRLYSIYEVKHSARIRDTVRRIDLDTITFAFGSAEISEDAIPRLDNVARAMERLLEENPAETFLIEGHTDAVGSDLANLALSDRRAEAVAAALTDVFGIPPENLITQGYGEQYLKIDTEAPEERNRRVAIRRITPLVAPVASAN